MAKWLGALGDEFTVGRWLVILVAVLGGGLFLAKGPLSTGTTQHVTTPPAQEAGPFISKAGDAMRGLHSMKVTLDGTVVVGGGASVQITGTGVLTYPHEEDLTLQLRFPASIPGAEDTIIPLYEKISKGRVYMRTDPAKPYQDVTGGKSASVVPAMDPIANLDFAHAFRASDDLGDGVMDGVFVHHFSLNVDPAQYVQQLKADPENPLSATEQAELTNAGIQAQVWIAAKDFYVHQMQISMITPQVRWDVTYRYSEFVPGGGPASA